MRYRTFLARPVLPVLIVTSLILFGSLAGCGGDYRKKARGNIGEVYVVMDSTRHQGKVAESIRDLFLSRLPGLPQYEPRYNLKFVDFDSQERLEQIKQLKNIVFVAPIDEQSNVGQYIRALLGEEVEQSIRNEERFLIQLEDKWYRDQWTMILSSTSEEKLIEGINDAGLSMLEGLQQKVIRRWKAEVYERGEQVALSDSLWNKFGWKIRIQHDYQWNIDSTRFVSFRRFLPENDRWIWGWWQNGVDNIGHIDQAWINRKRDSLNKIYLRGTRDSSYITTEYRRDITTETKRINGYYTFITRGTWRMTEDLMGGPFLNYVYYDEATRRLFMVEFGQFAPKYNKRRFVRQFEAMGHTFRADSSYTY